MTCACETDDKGNVTAPCGAHVQWFRDQAKLGCDYPAHMDYAQVLKDRDYQRKRADKFERLLVEGK